MKLRIYGKIMPDGISENMNSRFCPEGINQLSQVEIPGHLSQKASSVRDTDRASNFGTVPDVPGQLAPIQYRKSNNNWENVGIYHSPNLVNLNPIPKYQCGNLS